MLTLLLGGLFILIQFLVSTFSTILIKLFMTPIKKQKQMKSKFFSFSVLHIVPYFLFFWRKFLFENFFENEKKMSLISHFSCWLILAQFHSLHKVCVSVHRMKELLVRGKIPAVWWVSLSAKKNFELSI